jgi:hypothetical protein
MYVPFTTPILLLNRDRDVPYDTVQVRLLKYIELYRGGSVNRCFQFGKFSRKAGCGMRETREGAPTYLHGLWEYLGRKPRVFRCLVFEIALSSSLY